MHCGYIHARCICVHKQSIKYRYKGLSFNWNTEDRYFELMNFEMKVTNILEMKACKLADEEKVPVVGNGLVGKVYNVYRHSSMKKCKTAKRLSSILNCKFKPIHN